MRIRVQNAIGLSIFSLIIRTILILGSLKRQAHGFRIDENMSPPGFSSLLDVQNHYLKTGTGARLYDPRFSLWNRWTNAHGPLYQRFNEELFRHDRRQFLPQGLFQSQALRQQPTSNIMNANYIHDLMRMFSGQEGKSLNELVITKEQSTPSVKFWSKRDTKAQTVPQSKLVVGDAIQVNKSEKYAMMDKALEKLQTDPRCKDKLELCAKNPVKNLQCLLHCHLSTNALAQPSTKFLFRLLKVYASYPKMLCPTFGRIYNEIPAVLRERHHANSLVGFLSSLGITGAAPVNVDFVKIAPSALFNNLVKFGQGEDIEMVKTIVDTAETAATVQLSERNQFPSMFGNPLCKLNPKEGWFLSMVDTMTKHPTLTDVFLRGYWVLTRALSMEMQYPLNALFVSMVHAMKLMTGVDCSIIAYAEQGKPFKCHRPPPIDSVLEDFTNEAKRMADKDSLSWMVCGAYQVEIPDWIQKKEGLRGRASDLRNNKDKTAGVQYEDSGEFPNPDELYPYDKV